MASLNLAFLSNREGAKNAKEEGREEEKRRVCVRFTDLGWVHLSFANMSVGAKHDRSKYEIITNNLYAVMLRPLQK